MATLAGIRRFAFRELARWQPFLRPALLAHKDGSFADEVLAAQRREFERLLDLAEDPGWFAPQMRMFTLSGAVYIALFLALSRHGVSAQRVWEVCDAATRQRFAATQGVERWLAGPGMLSGPMQAISRWLARRSQKRPLGGWVFSFIEREPGQFEYGVNYSRCAIRELALSAGAADFAPYICLADIAGSEAFAWGLARSQTLAQGGAHCDFRFRRAASTDVKVRLPVVPS
ncbi:MAG: L-2-amino-thiazoline-4-carboxylic acid hydrolase [Myxococcales bacterium]|nr:L-2-amino-thiazoline-4-carboxylic acid hydrolase [Myxococcales bacterium]